MAKFSVVAPVRFELTVGSSPRLVYSQPPPLTGIRRHICLATEAGFDTGTTAVLAVTDLIYLPNERHMGSARLHSATP